MSKVKGEFFGKSDKKRAADLCKITEGADAKKRNEIPAKTLKKKRNQRGKAAESPGFREESKGTGQLFRCRICLFSIFACGEKNKML